MKKFNTACLRMECHISQECLGDCIVLPTEDIQDHNAGRLAFEWFSRTKSQKTIDFEQTAKKYTEKHSKTPEDALACLVKIGICLPNGGLAPPYQNKDENQSILDSELLTRFWSLFDAAKRICDEDTPDAWKDLYIAVANIPESQKPT